MSGDCQHQAGNEDRGSTWDVLHQDRSGLSALILLEETQPELHHALAVFPQQLHRDGSYVTSMHIPAEGMHCRVSKLARNFMFNAGRIKCSKVLRCLPCTQQG